MSVVYDGGWPQPCHEIPVVDDRLDAPDSAVITIGGVRMERVGDRWVPRETACVAETVRLTGRGETVRYRCQGHAGPAARAHRCLVGDGSEVAWWWTWGGDRTQIRIGPADLS